MADIVDFKRNWTYAELQVLQREAAKASVMYGGEIREGDHVFGKSGLWLGCYPGLAAEMEEDLRRSVSDGEKIVVDFTERKQ